MLKTLRKIPITIGLLIGLLTGLLTRKIPLYLTLELVLLLVVIKFFTWQTLSVYMIQLPVMLEVILRNRENR